MSSYKETYETWMGFHSKQSRGERKRRLEKGCGPAEMLFLENVWWPAVGNLEYLAPEFEMDDFQDGKRFFDFAYLRPPYRIGIEIDGYGPHWRDASRWQFADHIMRQNHLVVDGWKVIRFSYDDVKEKPRRCQQVVQQFLGKWFGNPTISEGKRLSPYEKEIIRLGLRKQQPLTLANVTLHLSIGEKFARKLLRGLAESGIVQPVSGIKRVHAYRLVQAADELEAWLD